VKYRFRIRFEYARIVATFESSDLAFESFAAVVESFV